MNRTALAAAITATPLAAAAEPAYDAQRAASTPGVTASPCTPAAAAGDRRIE